MKDKYWLNYWHILISKGTSGFISNTLLIQLYDVTSILVNNSIVITLQIHLFHSKSES